MEKNRKTSEKKKETETIEVGPYNVNFFEMPKLTITVVRNFRSASRA